MKVVSSIMNSIMNVINMINMFCTDLIAGGPDSITGIESRRHSTGFLLTQ